jgi:hypothetical protein
MLIAVRILMVRLSRARRENGGAQGPGDCHHVSTLQDRFKLRGGGLTRKTMASQKNEEGCGGLWRTGELERHYPARTGCLSGVQPRPNSSRSWKSPSLCLLQDVVIINRSGRPSCSGMVVGDCGGRNIVSLTSSFVDIPEPLTLSAASTHSSYYLFKLIPIVRLFIMPFSSPYPDIKIPQSNILSYLFGGSPASQEPLWLDSSDAFKSLSPSQALQWVRRLGFGLEHRLGLARGDVVMICTPNHIFVPVAYLGIVGAGCVFSGANPAYTVPGSSSCLSRLSKEE